VDQFIPARSVASFWYCINLADQIERFNNRQVPPELCPLTKDHADPPNMFDALLPGDAAHYRNMSGIRHQNSGKNFDRRALSRAIWSDVPDQLTSRYRKRYVIQRADLPDLAPEESFDASHQAGCADGNMKGLRKILDNDM